MPSPTHRDPRLISVDRIAYSVMVVAGAILQRLPAWVVFGATALYWASGMAAGSAWNVWVERIVPTRVRRRYFARRTGVVNLGVLGSSLAGGAVLEIAPDSGRPLAGFAILFIVSAAARLVSSRTLAALREPEALREEAALTTPSLPLPRRMPASDGGRLLLYALALITATTTASPYFSPYMLRHLALTYGEYTVLLGIALEAKVLVMPIAAHLARRVGLVAMLRGAWLGIATIPLLWLVSDSSAYLCGLQLVAGAA